MPGKVCSTSTVVPGASTVCTSPVRRARQRPLVRLLEPAEPHPVTGLVGLAQLGELLGGDLTGPAEQLAGEVGGGGAPPGALLEDQPRDRVDDRLHLVVAIAAELDDRHELVGLHARAGQGLGRRVAGSTCSVSTSVWVSAA